MKGDRGAQRLETSCQSSSWSPLAFEHSGGPASAPSVGLVMGGQGPSWLQLEPSPIPGSVSTKQTVKGFGVVNKAEVDAFLELSCFFDDATDVVSLISGSSAFSKSSLNVWEFSVHVLLKPSLENFEYHFASM